MCLGTVCECTDTSEIVCGADAGFSGVCTSIYTDPNNCGACGLVCPAQLASCIHGQCAVAPVVIMADQYQSCGIASDSNNVYWVSGYDVVQAPIDGGPPLTLATGVAIVGFPMDVAVGGGRVYWTSENPDSVRSIPIGGGTIATITSQVNGPANIATDQNNVYWTTWYGWPNPDAGGTVMQAQLDGGGLLTLATGQPSPTAVAIDSNSVYWINAATGNLDGTVMTVPIGGGPSTTLAAGYGFATPELQPEETLVVSGQTLYWVGSGGGSPWPDIWRVAVDGGTPTAFGLSSNSFIAPFAIAVDSTKVYWSSETGNSIMSANHDGSGMATLASSLSYPGPLAVSATSIFWSCAGDSFIAANDCPVLELTPK